ncbi:MAG TPA: hypothetical protein VE891_10400 [Allosphingosinicella sp.]|nr:hypothetical protein [Allosphingosinicella sp.]
MIDNFSLALTHGLLLLVAWRLLSRTDLDEDPAPGAEPAAPKSRRWTLGKARPDA